MTDNNIIDYLFSLSNKDGYINITELCKTFEKDFSEWKKEKNSKLFIKELCKEQNCSSKKLIKKIKNDIYVNRLIAYNVAQWISPTFSVQVINWMTDLMKNGKISI